jgi:uncharacterized protein
MLQMRPNCECCDLDLPADQAGAFICSFECTFCESCAMRRLNGLCPNCRGLLVVRPLRHASKFDTYPPSKDRVLKAEGCP